MSTLLAPALATSLGALDANAADSLTFRGMALELGVSLHG
jgi:hypothetical protein